MYESLSPGVIFVIKLPFRTAMNFIRIFSLMIVCIFAKAQDTKHVYQINNGRASFKSDAPLELIRAASTELKGLIDFEEGTFAFTIPIKSFMGFNSALQREHFNANYMESESFPKATFSGKLIEKIDINQDGEYKIRAKGKLNIHGVEQERIIPSTVIVKNGKLGISSSFTVLLADHNIDIPKVVQHKVAE